MKELYFKISDFYKKIAKYIFTCLAVLCPVFTIYGSPIPKVGLLEFLLILFVITTLVFDFKKYTLCKALIPFFVALSINVIYVSWSHVSNDINDAIGTSLRLIFFYFLLIAFTQDYFSYDFGLKVLVVAATILALYGLLQEVFSFAHIYLYNYIPYLPGIDGKDLSKYWMIQDIEIFNLTYRMRSLFTEPAHFATYLIIPATLLLLKKNKTIYTYIFSFFFYGVTFLTLSSMGIIVSSLCLLAYFIIAIVKKELKLYQIIIVASVIAVGIGLFFALGGWKYFIEKTFHKGSFIGILQDSRLTVTPLLIPKQFWTMVFGIGLSNSSYMATFVLATHKIGLIGLIGLSCTIGLLFSNVTKRSTIALFLVYIFMNVGSEIAFGAFIMPFLPFLIIDKEETVTLFKKMSF